MNQTNRLRRLKQELVRKVKPMRNSIVLMSLVAALAVPSASVEGDEIAPEHVRIELTSYRITPAVIRLERGRTYVLDLENSSGSSHDFTARDLFASAAMAPAERVKVERGEVELKGHKSAAVTLTPTRAGNYEFHCSHPFHQMLGMRGVVQVN